MISKEDLEKATLYAHGDKNYYLYDIEGTPMLAKVELDDMFGVLPTPDSIKLSIIRPILIYGKFKKVWKKISVQVFLNKSRNKKAIDVEIVTLNGYDESASLDRDVENYVLSIMGITREEVNSIINPYDVYVDESGIATMLKGIVDGFNKPIAFKEDSLNDMIDSLMSEYKDKVIDYED